jgi:succinyl-CoA synthetase beta subunit
VKLYEHQAKDVFARHGLRVPRGGIAFTPDDAARIAGDLASPVVLKPQLGVKGRGKVGGILFADDPEDASQAAERLLGMDIKGEVVKRLLVEERVEIAEELYVAVVVDTALRSPVLIACAEGGVDVEEVARERPERVRRLPIDILEGPCGADLTAAGDLLGADAAEHLATLYRIFREYDAEIVEVNPLVRTTAGDLVAVDAVLNVNHDSVFRHDDLIALRAEAPVEDPIAEEAREAGWTYIELPGDVGVLSSGAGLTMAILDLIHAAGGTPANFLDTAQIDDEGMRDAFDLLARAGNYRVLLVNIFAGLNRCDLLAEGIRGWLEGHDLGVPVVVRMVGNLEEEGHRILREGGFEPFAGLEEAVGEAVRLAAEGGR